MRFAAAMPEAHCELYYRTPFQLLCSVVLSAQTTDKMVNRCMQPVYDQGFTPDTILALGEQGLLQIIKSIGLAPTKAKNLVKLAHIVKEQHGGEIPRTRAELEALPGVGRKTANVILGEIWREPTLAVDTHVFRVSRRLGLQNEATPEKAEQALLKVVDAKYLPMAHHWLILHGRYTCKAVNPACESCILADLCPSAFVEQDAKKEAKAQRSEAKLAQKHAESVRARAAPAKQAAKAAPAAKARSRQARA